MTAMQTQLVTALALHPYTVGGIALGILLALLAITMIFGGGRDHS